MVSIDLIKKMFTIRDEKILQQLCEMGEIRTYKKEEVIFQIGEMQQYIYILVDGIVYSSLIDVMQTKITDCFITSSGYPVNAPNLKLPSCIEVKTLKETTLLELPLEPVLALMMDCAAVAMEYVRLMQMSMTVHCYSANMRIHYDAGVRYDWFRKEYPEVDRLASNYLIASYLGIKSETLSRLRRRIKDHEQIGRGEDAALYVTRDLEWNYEKMLDAVVKGQYTVE